MTRRLWEGKITTLERAAGRWACVREESLGEDDGTVKSRCYNGTGGGVERRSVWSKWSNMLSSYGDKHTREGSDSGVRAILSKGNEGRGHVAKPWGLLWGGISWVLINPEEAGSEHVEGTGMDDPRAKRQLSSQQIVPLWLLSQTIQYYPVTCTLHWQVTLPVIWVVSIGLVLQGP